MRQSTRYGIAAALIVLSAAGTTTGARADEWCGYGARDKSLIECGYSSLTECTSTIGAGATCFVDPDVAANMNHATPATSPKPTNRSNNGRS